MGQEEHFSGSAKSKLMQMALVVPDIQRAIGVYRSKLNAGPWFLLERFTPANATYRGRPSNLSISVAFAYRNDIMLELVEQHDDSPSVFKDVVAVRGYGLHHLGVATSEYELLVHQYVSSGYEIAFTAETPGRLAIMHAVELPHMVEVLELDQKRQAFFKSIYEASLEWDGTDPIRRV